MLPGFIDLLDLRHVRHRTPRGHITEHLETLATYFTDSPDRIIVELSMRASLGSNSESFPCKLVEQFDFSEGKIIGLTVYFFDVPQIAAQQATARFA